MSRSRGLLLLAVLGSLASSRPCVAAVPPSPSAEERFELEIRPVLVRTCFPCHGGKKTSAGLKVDSRDALVRGGDSGAAIVPARPEESLLIRAIGYNDSDLQMPPGKRLPDATLAAFKAWISEGAVWPKSDAAGVAREGFRTQKHWAFEAVKAVQPPEDPTGWSLHPIDRFVAARQRAEGVRPVPDASRRVWIRRVTMDLIGLPPTPEEVDAFVSDKSADAFGRVIDRLLGSPHYGERWGRHWMDVVRYADTAGDNADYPVPEAARYRDYIIAAFNSDKPFDRFVKEQIAGDLLATTDSKEQAESDVVATTYLALSRRYATAPYELWHLTLEDTIDTTGKAFLGLSLRCARCHDHKFDPVTQRDYYALYGIFDSTQFPYAGSEEFITKKFPRLHFVPTASKERIRSASDAVANEVKALEKRIAQAESRKSKNPDGLASMKARREKLHRLAMLPEVHLAYAVGEGKPHDVPIQLGGDPERPGSIVSRGVPRFDFLGMKSPPSPAPNSSGRLQLANWLTRPDHPLTARVIANRIWQHHFGRGIVATPSNFGIRGEPPSHPELLDWLAARLVSSGWSIKDLHRQILSSRTYRLASSEDQSNEAADPGNRLFWRFDRQRLDAESIRDGMLAVSGQLDTRAIRIHPFPPIEQWPWTQHKAFKAIYPTDQRSVYLMTQRLVKHPFLALWDGPDTNTSSDLRTRSTVPLQALFLMHNPFVRAQGAALAQRLEREVTDQHARIRRLWELAWGRPPSASELERAHRYLDDYAATARLQEPSNAASEEQAWESLARLMLISNEFLYVD